MSTSSGASGLATMWHDRRLRGLLAVGFGLNVSIGVTMSSVPVWAVDNGVATSSAALPISVLLLLTIATQPLVPSVAARVRPDALLIVGITALAGPALFYGLAKGLPGLVALSAVRGVGMGIVTVSATTLIVSLAPKHRRGEVVGTFGVITMVPVFAGVPIGAALAGAQLFSIVWIIAGFPLLAAPLAWGIDRWHDGDSSAPVEEHGSRLAAMRAVFGPSAMLLVAMVACGCFLSYLPVALRAGHLATWALLALGICAGTSRWGSGLLADGGAIRALVPASSAAVAAGTLIVALGLGTHSPASDALIVVGSAIFGLGIGSVNTATMLVTFARVSHAGAHTASAMWNFSIDTGTAIGPLLAGVLATTTLGLGGAFGVIGLLVLATVPLAFAVGRLGAATMPVGAGA